MSEKLIDNHGEDYAFYESGLSADGCLEKLDEYTRKAIKRYGEILLEKQKEDFVSGIKGCCYCCEPVGELNQKLEKEIEKYKYILDKNRSEEMLFRTELRTKIKTLEKLLEQKVKDAEEFQEMSIKELARAEEYKFAVEEQKKYIILLEERLKNLDPTQKFNNIIERAKKDGWVIITGEPSVEDYQLSVWDPNGIKRFEGRIKHTAEIPKEVVDITGMMIVLKTKP